MTVEQFTYLANSGLWSLTWLLVGYGFGRLYKRLDRIEKHLTEIERMKTDDNT